MEDGASKVSRKTIDKSVTTELRERSSRSSSSSVGSSTLEGGGDKAKPPSSPLGWPIRRARSGDSRKYVQVSGGSKEKTVQSGDEADAKFLRLGSKLSEMDMMKERFSKLLLGEDMSGSGKGVCTALAISNAITNLCATAFGQLWRLEPLPSEKKAMWRREMEWLLCVGDHIVELIPSWQTFPDGSKLEVMTCRPRSDIFMNLPALKKLDNMLLEILDSFTETEFWYVDKGIIASDADGSASFRKTLQRQEDKWWLPVPRVTAGGLSERSRKQLSHTRECANQILKAAMAINNITVAEMEVPDSFLETLPKNGKSCLGDLIYRYITSDQFSSECLLDCLDLSSEHIALEVANRIESAIYVWRKRAHPKPQPNPNRSTVKSSWEMVRDLMVDGDKREFFAGRAESLLISLKQRFPSLTQTTLDTSKIQFNKDVGKAILESYSRVLESLAFNIVARIDDLLYVDDLTKRSDKLSSVPPASMITHKKGSIPYSAPLSGTPYKTTFSTSSFSPAQLVSPARVERTPFLNKTNIMNNNNSSKPHHRLGFGVKRALTGYLTTADSKAKICGNAADGLSTNPLANSTEASANQKDQNNTPRRSC